ncbi:MAG: hypothetical protein M1598_01300 [Actinobacteria bacterium]|nr:hypothetical protein [Actinomycetota bacterium]
MRCVHHPENEAVTLCQACNEPICAACRVEVNGREYCSACLDRKLGTPRKPSGTRWVGGPGEKKSPFWTFVLSFVPGVGHMYLDLMRRGLSLLIVFFGAIAVGTILQEIIPLVTPVIWFYGMFDALQSMRRINNGEEVPDVEVVDFGHLQRNQKVWAYALIILGGLALLRNLMPYFWRLDRVFLPLILIGAGFWLLFGDRFRGWSKGGSSRDAQ